MIQKSLLLLAPTLLALSVPAHGQFTAYGMVTVDKLSGIRSSPVLSLLTPGTTYNNSVNPIGFTGGVSYDIKTLGPALLSADLRGVVESATRGAQTTSVGSGTRLYSGLGGVRASFNTPLSAVQPYVQLSAGYARSNYGVLTNAQVLPGATAFPAIPTQNSLEYHVFVGTDVRLLPSLDFRVFELGIGGLQAFGTYAHSYPIYSLSSGLVLHIPPRQ